MQAGRQTKQQVNMIRHECGCEDGRVPIKDEPL
jgi:hypothetical protein